MTRPKTKKTVISYFEKLSPDVMRYFEHLPNLIKDYPWEVALSYVFWRVELAQTNSIYCGIVKLQSAESSLARKAVNESRRSRSQFKEKFDMVFGKPVKATLSTKLGHAEKVRDRVIHGKEVKDEVKREAVLDILEFAEGFNSFVSSLAGFKPFGDLRGYKGRGKPMDKSTTRWILKGMGFDIR